MLGGREIPLWVVALYTCRAGCTLGSGDTGCSLPCPRCISSPPFHHGFLFPQESRNLFCCLYRSWCHNPVTTVSLCFLTQNYKHAYDLIQKLYPLGFYCLEYLGGSGPLT